MPSKHDTSTLCRFNAGPPSPTLAINIQQWTVLSVGSSVSVVQADTDPMYVKCWASVAGAGHIARS